MAANNYSVIARQYAEQVVEGEILTCKWVQRACQRQLDDLAKFRGKSSPFRFNPKLTDNSGRVQWYQIRRRDGHFSEAPSPRRQLSKAFGWLNINVLEP